MYRVLHYFKDRDDNEHKYQAGDKFPRDGMTVSQARIVELSGNGNAQGRPLIEFVQKWVPPIQTAEEPPSTEPSEAVSAEPAEVTEPAEQTAYTEEELSAKPKKDLQAIATDRGYKITGTNKAEIIAEILAQQ